MIYYYQQKDAQGLINIINPFRGTIVLGTPGSGKSFGIIDPFIRQHAAKGFAMMVYDYKFPHWLKRCFISIAKTNGTDIYLEMWFSYCELYGCGIFQPYQSYSTKIYPDLAELGNGCDTTGSLNKGGDKKAVAKLSFRILLRTFWHPSFISS